MPGRQEKLIITSKHSIKGPPPPPHRPPLPEAMRLNQPPFTDLTLLGRASLISISSPFRGSREPTGEPAPQALSAVTLVSGEAKQAARTNIWARIGRYQPLVSHMARCSLVHSAWGWGRAAKGESKPESLMAPVGRGRIRAVCWPCRIIPRVIPLVCVGIKAGALTVCR